MITIKESTREDVKNIQSLYDILIRMLHSREEANALLKNMITDQNDR